LQISEGRNQIDVDDPYTPGYTERDTKTPICAASCSNGKLVPIKAFGARRKARAVARARDR
jgi:hypothetical protein